MIHQVNSPVTDCQPNDNVEAMRVWMNDKKVLYPITRMAILF